MGPTYPIGPTSQPSPSPSELRADALACIEAAIAAVDPERLVRQWLEQHADAWQRPATGRGAIHLAAFGKAAAGMARGAVAVLGERLAGGVVIVPSPDADNGPGLPGRFPVFHGGHPVPSDEGVAGARAILDLAQGLTEGDLLLALASGGGSSLMTLPAEGVPLEAIRETIETLLEAGADIRRLNIVRKHLDGLKGGRLALAAHPARTLALLLSDVVGDPVDTIASGPLSPDPTTYDDALRAIAELGQSGDRIPESVRRHLERGRRGEIDESPKPGDPAFASVEVHVVGNNRLAAEAARREAERRGYRALVLTTSLTGEAREVGRVLAGIGSEILTAGTPLAPPACVVAGGETTVTVRGSGRGGRNQEVALGAAVALDELVGPGRESEAAGAHGDRLLVASVGTDGVDGPTDAAGAIASESTLCRARNRRLDAHRALAENDAFPFFDTLGDLIETGPTGTNVMDLALVLVRA